MQTTDELLAWLVENGPTTDEVEYECDTVYLSLSHVANRNRWLAGFWWAKGDTASDMSPNWYASGETPWAALRRLVNVVNELRSQGFTREKYQKETAPIRDRMEAMLPVFNEIWGSESGS